MACKRSGVRIPLAPLPVPSRSWVSRSPSPRSPRTVPASCGSRRTAASPAWDTSTTTRSPTRTGPRPPDEIARRLLATGKVDGVHVYMNMITVDVKKGHDSSGLSDVIEGLYTYWQPGHGAAGLRGRRGRGTRGRGTGRDRRRAGGRRDVGSREARSCRAARTQPPRAREGESEGRRRRVGRAARPSRDGQAVVTRSAHARRGTSDHRRSSS